MNAQYIQHTKRFGYNIYGPCHAEGKAIFLDWFSNITMADDIDWIVMGDFNFIRNPKDRNKPGEMLMICCFSMKPSVI
jgi:hypothetical protein